MGTALSHGHRPLSWAPPSLMGTAAFIGMDTEIEVEVTDGQGPVTTIDRLPGRTVIVNTVFLISV